MFKALKVILRIYAGGILERYRFNINQAMTLTPAQQQLIKQSRRKLEFLDTKPAEDFYTCLFAEEPELRSMFAADMAVQYRKLTDMILFIIEHIEDTDRLSAEIKALAFRHVGYGTKTWHYEAAGHALLHALKAAMGTDWTIELMQAWEKTYEVLSGMMIDAVTGAAGNE